MAKMQTKKGKAEKADAKKKAGDGDGIKLIASNRRARFDYFVVEKFEAGVQLVGSEVKSLREGHCQLQGSFCRIKDDSYDVTMYGALIAEWSQAGPFFQHDPQRDRRLLLHKKEVAKIRKELKQQGTTLIPLRMYFKRGKAKVEIGICRGKRSQDKREDIKKRDAKREIDRARKM